MKMAVDARERTRKYVSEAEAKMKSLEKEIARLQAAQSKKDPIRKADWQVGVADLQGRLKDLRNQVESLSRSGETQWEELQTKAEIGLWDLRSLVQRVSESAEPLLTPGAAEKKSRYFLQMSGRGTWVLVRQGAKAPSKQFPTKAEGLHFSRRYVRGKAPAELIVRRRDGTFEVVHGYRK